MCVIHTYAHMHLRALPKEYLKSIMKCSLNQLPRQGCSGCGRFPEAGESGAGLWTRGRMWAWPRPTSWPWISGRENGRARGTDYAGKAVGSWASSGEGETMVAVLWILESDKHSARETASPWLRHSESYCSS